MKYTFYIDYKNGSRYEEEGLTRRQAVIRYNKYGKSNWSYEAKQYGYRLESE
jgi:hypothetical protein